MVAFKLVVFPLLHCGGVGDAAVFGGVCLGAIVTSTACYNVNFPTQLVCIVSQVSSVAKNRRHTQTPKRDLAGQRYGNCVMFAPHAQRCIIEL